MRPQRPPFVSLPPRRQAPLERPTHCICREPLEELDRPGRKPKYCSNAAHSRIADAVGALRTLLAENPETLLWVVQQLDEVRVTLAPFSDAEQRALRRACFRLGSRGTKLEPGSSGRYQRGLTASEAGQVRAANMLRINGRFARAHDARTDGPPVTLADIAHPAGLSTSEVRELAQAGLELRRAGGGRVRLVRIRYPR